MFAWRDNYTSAGGSVDPYWSSVSFLENFESTPTGYTDSSGNNNILSGISTAKPSTLSPFTGYQGSIYVNNSYLVTPYNSGFDLSGTTWTMEAWFYSLSFAGNQTIVSKDKYGVNYDWAIEIPNSTTISIHTNGYGSVFSATVPTMSAGTWYHVAIVRDGGTLKIYLNGTSYGGSSTMAFTNASQDYVTIGCIGYNSPTFYFIGYISNLRIVKGTAVYTSNFTPPTTPLTAISGTTLLLNTSNQGLQQNGIVIDTSTNNFGVTRTGTSYYTASSPFGTQYPGSWYTSTGASNYLSIPDNAAWTLTGDFCLEGWVYPTSLSASVAIMSQWPGGGAATNQAFIFTITTTGKLNLTYGIGGTNANVTGTSVSVTTNQWNHVAITRSGTTVRLFVNGVQDSTTGSLSGSFNNSNGSLFIAQQQGNNQPYFGYLSNLRIVNGSAVYTSSFTPSTTPLTAITNTVLLLPMSGAFYDISNQKNLVTTTTPTNTQYAILNVNNKKWNSQSSQYTGNGYQTVVDNTSLQFGTGDLTVEGWVYRNAAGALHSLLCKGTGATPTGWLLQINSSNQLVLTVATAALITSSTTIGATTWTHFAWTRRGSTNYLFVNGTVQTTATDSTNFNQTTNMFVGCDRLNLNGLNGYLDDVRVTKGVARYVASFTAPTMPFPTRGKP